MKKKDFFTKFAASQPDELESEIIKLKAKLNFKSNQLATNQEKNTASLHQIRRQIAWLKTLEVQAYYRLDKSSRPAKK